ncbi:hypothetical protein M407DRAFT_199455 [Tulasnella calospora MUT 4182]|uniref:Phospholipase n=1 Tax=Tulasnella calospora MUT 4182 TaxID=1051891 RepID=A0A0C3QK08_9AGAM|nr:hypothetical protein M407DRAFT_199455 [Tulasnella calospora MUT 4182]
MGLLDSIKQDIGKLGEFVEEHGVRHAVKEGVVATFKTVSGAVDPNDNHDDVEEKEVDKIRESICASHRFRSFAGERSRNAVKWYIDGHDYFWAVSEILESAKQCIFILDWWLSPELYLRRPPSDFPQFRLDRLLKRKAEQGVKVYICVYKEITQTMNMSSNHTKEALQALHPNIKVMRHPDHIGSKNDVQFWSHHEKVVVVDNHRACIGGLDMCFGRWDTHNHPLADCHPTDFTRTLFPGQDYNNGRVMDFQQVDNFVSSQISILETARMPWHDVHLALAGPAVLDVVQHFVERWNKIKKEKYKDDVTYDWLAFPHNTAKFTQEPVSRLPYAEVWGSIGTKFQNRWQPNDDSHSRGGSSSGLNALSPFEPPEGATAAIYDDHYQQTTGTCNVQVVRSVSDWSHGVLKEQSIQNAYIQLIQEANHFIYIENQFFLSNAADGGPVVNKVAKAIVERILSAAREGKKFKVIVMLPEVPGFSGDIEQEGSIKTIMAGQWRTINRGGNSIYELIRKAGYDPTDYIRFYHLRSFDRINAPKSFIEQMARDSGVSFFQAQMAQARLFLGNDTTWKQDKIQISAPATYTGENTSDLGTTEKQGTTMVEEVKFYQNLEEARQVVRKFERAAGRSDEEVSDSLSQHLLADTTGLMSEQWLGSEQEERDCYVTELLYIHSKVMIVDDRRVIMGSANINDRSQKGDGDSEIAVIVEDTDQIETTMDGRPFVANRFAATLRRKIMKEHLGLIPPQFCETGKEPVTSFMRAVPYPSEDETQSNEDRLVADPLSDQFLELWDGTARKNRQIFGEIFKTVPTDVVRNWDQYKAYLPKVKTGHIASDLPIYQVKEKLAGIRGAIVTAPIDFLIEENGLVTGPEWLGLNPTLPIYI